MVVSIRELANITYFTTSIANIFNNLTPNSNINMVIDLVDNIFDIGDSFKAEKGCSLSLSIHKPRSSSISSSEHSEDYHIRVKRDNDRIDEDKPVSSISSIKIEYASQEEQKD